MQEGTLGDVTQAPKAAYIYIVNPIGNEPDRLKWISSLDAMELVVVSDMFMSETANYADYVLPVAFLFERNDIASSQNPFVKLSEKAVEPLFEAKGDFEIITLLGKAMGFEDKFTMTEEEFLASCVSGPAAEAVGLSWEKLKEEHAVCRDVPRRAGGGGGSTTPRRSRRRAVSSSITKASSPWPTWARNGT